MQPWAGIAASRHKDPEVRNDIMEIDRFLHEVSNGLANVQRGEVPDSSGDHIGDNGSLLDYFFLPGRAGGQVAIGGTGADDQLTFKGNTTSIMPPSAVPLMRLLLPITGATSTSHGFAIEDAAGNLVFDAKANGSLLLEDPTSYASGNPIMLDLHATTASSGGTIFRIRGGASEVFRTTYYGTTTIDMAANSVAFLVDGFGGASDLTRWSNSGATLSYIDSTGAFNGPMLPTSLSVSDAVFSIFDDATPTKIAQFQLSSLSAGTNTFTFPAIAAGTFAIANLSQTFSKLQIFDPDTNVVPIQINASSSADSVQIRDTAGSATLSRFNNLGHLGIGPSIPGSTTRMALGSTTAGANMRAVNAIFSDSTFTGYSGGYLATYTSTVSNAAGGIPDTGAFNVVMTVTDAAGAVFGLTGQASIGDADAASPGTAFAHGLHFAATSGATVDLAEMTGVDSEATHTGSANIATMYGVVCRVNANASGGTITDGHAINPQLVLQSGTLTNAYGVRVTLGGTGSTVGTLYGLKLEDFSSVGATTYWAIYSAAGQSAHAGNLRVGSTSVPTAKVHMDAGSTSAGSAPAKYEAGSLMTSAEAGAREYDGSYHYLTNSSTRGQVCTTANVVVDGDGNVVTADGEILLAA